MFLFTSLAVIVSASMANEKFIVGVNFNPSNKLTNFRHLSSCNPANFLFIYNENVGQFRNKNDRSAGGGNGFMRKYRSDKDIRASPANALSADSVGMAALGIPTMFSQSIAHKTVSSKEFNELLNEVDAGLQQIRDYLTHHPTIQIILWSAGSDNRLGLDIAITNNLISSEQAESIKDRVSEGLTSIQGDFEFTPVRLPGAFETQFAPIHSAACTLQDGNNMRHTNGSPAQNPAQNPAQTPTHMNPLFLILLIAIPLVLIVAGFFYYRMPK